MNRACVARRRGGAARPVPVARERGTATLLVTLALLAGVTIAALYAQARHGVELRAGAAQARAARAFEAAEAGLAWATAMLDEPRAVDAACRPVAAAGASFRDRHMSIAPGTGVVTPLAGERDGMTVPRRAACVRAPQAWRCACAGDDDPRPDAPAGASAAFVVQFGPASHPGLVALEALGCAQWPCAPAPADSAQASVRLDVALGLLPGIDAVPAAPLTARGEVLAGPDGLGLHNADPSSGGWVVHAGGTVHGSDARWSGPPGAPGATLREDDARLRSLDPQRLFAALFGLDRPLWSRRAAVASVRCDGPCSARVVEALAHHRIVHVQGDARLDGPLALGTPERPVIVVGDGAVELRGAVAMHGLLHAAQVAWHDGGPGARLRGAIVSEGDFVASGTPDIVYDPGVLAALRTLGTFAALPGRWRDFP